MKRVDHEDESIVEFQSPYHDSEEITLQQIDDTLYLLGPGLPEKKEWYMHIMETDTRCDNEECEMQGRNKLTAFTMYSVENYEENIDIWLCESCLRKMGALLE
jgi:hypothetical protein